MSITETEMSEQEYELSMLPERCANLVGNAGWRDFWPIETREILVRASLTEGPLPLYAMGKVKDAMVVANRIERDMDRDWENAQKQKNRRF